MLLVTFSGIDGAGKSTLVGNLCCRLREAGVAVLPLAFWDDATVLPGLRDFASHALLGGERGVGAPAKPVNRRDKNVRCLPLTAGRLVLYLLDAVRLRVRVAQARRAQPEIVFFDRYLYDEVANLPLTGRFIRAYARLLFRLAPKPDLACLVDTNPVLARQRKPEYPLEFLHSNRRSFLALSNLLGGMLMVPSLSPGEAERAVLRELLARLPSVTPQEPIQSRPTWEDGLAGGNARGPVPLSDERSPRSS